MERTVNSEYHDEENDERSHILNKEYVGVIKLRGDKPRLLSVHVYYISL